MRTGQRALTILKLERSRLARGRTALSTTAPSACVQLEGVLKTVGVVEQRGQQTGTLGGGSGELWM